MCACLLARYEEALQREKDAMKKKKAKGPPKALIEAKDKWGNPLYEGWKQALKDQRIDDPDKELLELYGMFVKCAGKDKVLSTKEFYKNFNKKVTVNGSPMAGASSTAISRDLLIDRGLGQ